jgi:hypothetical protein
MGLFHSVEKRWPLYIAIARPPATIGEFLQAAGGIFPIEHPWGFESLEVWHQPEYWVTWFSLLENASIAKPKHTTNTFVFRLESRHLIVDLAEDGVVLTQGKEKTERTVATITLPFDPSNENETDKWLYFAELEAKAYASSVAPFIDHISSYGVL